MVRRRFTRGLLGAAFALPLLHVGWLYAGFLSIQDAEVSLVCTVIPTAPWQGVSVVLCIANLLLPGAVLAASLKARLPLREIVAVLWGFGLVYLCWGVCWLDVVELHQG